MNIDIKNQIREFFAALRKKYSYDIYQNSYIWFGVLWGTPIPIVTLLLEVHFHQSSGINYPLWTALHNPVQFFFLLHPLLFGAIFGILGTIRAEKDTDLAATIRQLKKTTSHDSLTGLKNRNYFSHIFHDECARSLRHKTPLTLLFLDIDHFKEVNDNHGHYIGDVVLKEIAIYLKKMCRPYDTAVRWGGEEFLILLSGTNEHDATKYAERIRQGIAAGFSPRVTIPLTISIGIAGYHYNDTLESITDRADQALYSAKNSGRNTVVAWSAMEK
jgi:diguanylate cyclase (GGDEF)-like protein